MKKQINQAIVRRGNYIFDNFDIDIDIDYKTYNFRKKNSQIDIVKGKFNTYIFKKIHVEEDGLYDYKHPRSLEGEKKQVTKYNSRFVYAIDKVSKTNEGIKVGIKWSYNDSNGKKLVKGKGQKQTCRVRKIILMKDSKFGNFSISAILNGSIKIMEECSVYDEENKMWEPLPKKYRTDWTEKWIKRKFRMVKNIKKYGRLTKEGKERRDKIIQDEFALFHVPRARLEEEYGLSKAWINKIIKCVREPKKIKLTNNHCKVIKSGNRQIINKTEKNKYGRKKKDKFLETEE